MKSLQILKLILKWIYKTFDISQLNWTWSQRDTGKMDGFNWVVLFVWLALNKTTECGMSEPQPLSENKTQTTSSFHPSAARLCRCVFSSFHYAVSPTQPYATSEQRMWCHFLYGFQLCCQRLMKQALDDSCARRWKHANKQGQRLELAYCECKLSQLLWLNRAALTSVSFVVPCQVDHLTALTGSHNLFVK